MRFLNYFSLLFCLTISLNAQTSLVTEIERIKSNPAVKVEYLNNNTIKVKYDKLNSRLFYLGDVEKRKAKTDSIPRFVFNLWEMDTSLFNYKYQFWQEVPLANNYIRPIVGDINNNNRLEYYGHKKDYFTDYSEIYCYEQDANSIFKQVYKYPSNTIIAYNIFDINRDGNLELHLLDTSHYIIDSINIGYIPNQSFFKKSSLNSLSDSIYFKYNIYTYDNMNSQLNDFTLGDFDKDSINEVIFFNFSPQEIWMVKFNEQDLTFDSVLAYPSWYYPNVGNEFVAGFVVRDFDLDGNTDIIYSSEYGNIYVLEYDENNTYRINWRGNSGIWNSYINFQTNDIDDNGKPEFWIGGESFSQNVSRLICYETDGNNSYHSVVEIEFPFLISLNPSRANSIDVDNDGKEEIFVKIGNIVVIIKFTGSPNNLIYEIYYFHKFEFTLLSAKLYKFPGKDYPSMILPMDYWQNGYGRDFTQLYKHYLTVDVKEEGEAINSYNLFENYPNPFNPLTNIKFSLASSSNVQIIVYNSIGEEIITLLNQSLTGGEHNVAWNGIDKNNNTVSSGVYFITMLANPDIFLGANGFQKTIKSVLIK